MTTITSLDIPVYLEWRDEEDQLQRQRVAMSMFILGRGGQPEQLDAPLPELGDLVEIQAYRKDAHDRYVNRPQWLLVVSRPRWTLREYQPLPERTQMLREVAIYCERADEEQAARYRPASR